MSTVQTIIGPTSVNG